MNKKIKRIGSRSEVFHENALMTSGGLKKNQLIKNARGYIVSKKKSTMAKNKKWNPLLKKGLQVPRGSKTFGVNQQKSKLSKKKSRTILNNIGSLFS